MNLYILDTEEERLCRTVSLLIAADSEQQARKIAMEYSRLSSIADRSSFTDPDYASEVAELLAIFSNKHVNYEMARHADEKPTDWFWARCLLIGEASQGTTPGVMMVDTIEP